MLSIFYAINTFAWRHANVFGPLGQTMIDKSIGNPGLPGLERVFLNNFATPLLDMGHGSFEQVHVQSFAAVFLGYEKAYH